MKIKQIAAACLLFAAGAAVSGECPRSIDWNLAQDIASGVKYVCVNMDEPREMAGHIVRVDLKTPGIRVTGTRRAPEWGKPMPDYTKKKMPIDTARQTTRDFLEEYRANGTNMVFAVNTSAWRPWEKPHNHKYGKFINFLVSGGEVVSNSRRRCPMLVVFTNNVAVGTNRLDTADVKSVAVAHPGYDIESILENGKVVKSKKKQYTPAIAPRTAMGVSADGRYVYALVVDGRQKGYSVGAELSDLARILRAAGADDAVNMDGGGSSTIAFWDGSKNETVIPNRHDAQRKNYRAVAANMGFYFEAR